VFRNIIEVQYIALKEGHHADSQHFPTVQAFALALKVGAVARSSYDETL
jgi:hypothetical protein